MNSALHAPVLASTIDRLSQLVASQRGGDENYFRHQLPRYRRTVQRIAALRPERCRVLDIGSHYLHQGVLLRCLGHEVCGIDIGLFTEADFVKDRAQAFGIDNITVNALEAGSFLPECDNCFDLIVFTEILEHITFNPIRFWRRVYELMAPGGIVYLSTPNALRPAAWSRSLIGLLAFRGIGLSVDEIMGNVTYGHHWKEYSAAEIRRYFALLSPDFSVTTSWYSSDLCDDRGMRTRLKKLLAAVPCFRSDIEAVVRRAGHGGFTARPPRLRMQEAADTPAPANAAGGPPCST
jgi:2-polyprenyl-6-hydroxyphenyl methylase/3-demethylubiquinone-9 3-methyltransferase